MHLLLFMLRYWLFLILAFLIVRAGLAVVGCPITIMRLIKLLLLLLLSIYVQSRICLNVLHLVITHLTSASLTFSDFEV